MSEIDIETEIRRKGLTAPRITPDHIESKIKDAVYHVFEGTCLTVCVLTLENGFTVTGESSCASPENFNVEIGRTIARDNAREKIWALEGYLLKEQLSRPVTSFRDRLTLELDQLQDRVTKLTAFLETEAYTALTTTDKKLLSAQLAAMEDYLSTLTTRMEDYLSTLTTRIEPLRK